MTSRIASVPVRATLLEDRRAATDFDPAREADRAELRSELSRCLAEIAPDHARVVVLKDALGLSFEEIAASSGMPVGTAKCYAHRGRNRLRDKLATSHERAGDRSDPLRTASRSC